MLRFFFAIVLSLLMPAFVAAQECEVTPANVPVEFIETVRKTYPSLTIEQAANIAASLQLVMSQKHIVEDESADPESRAFAERLADLAMEGAVLQAVSYSVLTEIYSVRDLMQAEADIGLTEVSAELEPTVREVARKTINIGLGAAAFSSKVVTLVTDRAATAGEGSRKEFIAALDDAICTGRRALDVFAGVGEFLPNAILLASVRHLRY